MDKETLLKKYYGELHILNNKINEEPLAEELKQLKRDKLYQIKQLIRNNKQVIYTYEEQ